MLSRNVVSGNIGIIGVHADPNFLVDVMLNAGKDEAVVLQALGVSKSTYLRWRKQYGGMKAEEARRVKELEEENKRRKQIMADQALDIQMLTHVSEGTW